MLPSGEFVATLTDHDIPYGPLLHDHPITVQMLKGCLDSVSGAPAVEVASNTYRSTRPSFCSQETVRNLLLIPWLDGSHSLNGVVINPRLQCIHSHLSLFTASGSLKQMILVTLYQSYNPQISLCLDTGVSI
jgi:hypothetical protein